MRNCISKLHRLYLEIASSKRGRGIVFTTIANALSRGVTVAVTLITVPLLLNYLGKVNYGFLMSITSMVSLLGFSDLGIGNSLMNALADADGKGNQDDAGEIVSSGAAVLVLSSLTIGFVFLILQNHISWKHFFNISYIENPSILNTTVLVVGICILFNTPISLIQRIQQGYQRGYETAIWQMIGTSLMFFLVILGVWFRFEMPVLAGVLVGGGSIATIVHGMILFRRMPWIRPRFLKIKKNLSFELLHCGLLFLILQVTHIVATGLDTMIVGRVVGLEAAADYSVTARMFIVIPMVLSFVQFPLWPAYREAISSGDEQWVKQSLKRAFLGTVSTAMVLAVGLGVLGKVFLVLWVGHEISVSTWFLWGMAIWMVVYTSGNAVTMFLHARNALKFQAVVWLCFAIFSLVMKIVIAQHVGFIAIPWINICMYLICVAIPMLVVVPKFFIVKNEHNSFPCSITEI